MLTATKLDLSLKKLPNKPKTIIVDIDGVIAEYDFPKIVNQKFGVNLQKKQIYAYDIADVLGVDPREVDDMFQEQVWGEPTFIPGALETLYRWEEEGNTILVLSNRIRYMKRNGLGVWLNEHGIPFYSILDLTASKPMFVDFHIDDSPAKLMSVNSTVKLLYAQPWNDGCLDVKHAFKRVYNWQEIKEVVG